MSRTLVTIKKITDIQSITGADRIVLATINGGWTCIVKKDEFKIGDDCVYFEIDSFVPASDDRFKFLERNFKIYNGILGAQIKTMKMKGVLSQGLALPISIFPEHKANDIAAELKVVKYIPDEEREEVVDDVKKGKWFDPIFKILPVFLRKRLYNYLYAKQGGSFPSFIRKTDQERVQNNSHFFTNDENLNQKYEITIKEDGSSITVFRHGNQVGVCSRNMCVWKRYLGFKGLFNKVRDVNNDFYHIAKNTGLIDAIIKSGLDISVQGELVGPKKNGNRSQRTDLNIFVFDIWDNKNKKYFSVSERKMIFDRLVVLGFKGTHVHTVCEGTLKELNLDTMEKMLEFPKTVKFPGIDLPVEGIVVKRYDGQFSFKSINNDYLVKYSL